MVDLQSEEDTILTPEGGAGLTEELQLEGSSNDTDHNQFLGSDEVNSLGDGVPGYQTTGVDGTDDDTEEQLPTP